MKRSVQVAAALFVVSLAGCANTGGFLVDRGRDAADVLTATVGLGGGVKVRVGPAQLGTLYNVDTHGLRGGDFGEVMWYEDYTREMLLPFPIELLEDPMGISGFGEERFCYATKTRTPALRGKGYISRVPFPLVGVARQAEYYTQLEVFIGALGTLRLGLNPGELVDFSLGWTGIDIYGDDLERKAKKPNETGAGPPLAVPARAPGSPARTNTSARQ